MLSRHAAKAFHRGYRDSSLIQFTSQLFPPSAETGCTMRAGSSLQTWLWVPPAKHFSRQIERIIERIEHLYMGC
jgi:hypothetical protein